jgi:TonB family protein
MDRAGLCRRLTIAALAALTSAATARAQLQKPPGSSEPPTGRRLEAQDGDTVVVRGSARVRIVHRSEAMVRAIYNAEQRWIVLIFDYSDPAGAPPDGKVDGSFRFDDVDGPWPLGDRWEGSAVVDDYAMSQGPGRVGMGLTTSAGFIQLFTNMYSEWFRDSRATAILSYRGSGGGNTPMRVSFDQAEQLAVREAARQAEMRAATRGVATAPQSGTPFRVGGNIKPPQKIFDVNPAYPAEAAQARIQGVVIIEATVGANGAVTEAKILRSIPLLDAAALDAVRQWRFEPTMVDGKAVPVIMTVTVNFSLR